MIDRLLSFASPFADHPGTIRLLERPDSSAAKIAAWRDALLAGTYPRPFLLEDGRTRGLMFNLDFIQTSMRLAAPDALDLEYLHYVMSFVLFHPRVRRIALLGLGGGAFAKYCLRHFPEVDFTAVEYSADVIALRDAFLIPPDDERFRVVHDDAAHFITQPNSFDIILADAYDPAGVAGSVNAPSFFAQARQRLTAQGILICNLAGTGESRHAQMEKLQEVFGDNLLLARVEDGCNHVALAFRDARFTPRWKWIESQGLALQKRFGVPLPKVAAEFRRNWERGWEQVVF